MPANITAETQTDADSNFSSKVVVFQILPVVVVTMIAVWMKLHSVQVENLQLKRWDQEEQQPEFLKRHLQPPQQNPNIEVEPL